MEAEKLQGLFSELEHEIRNSFDPNAGTEEQAWRAKVEQESAFRKEWGEQLACWDAQQSGAEDRLAAYGRRDMLPVLDFDGKYVEGIRQRLRELDESFSQSVLRWIDKKGMKDSECYHRARMSRKVFSKLRIDDNYQPSRETALSLAVALELSREETDELLAKAGYSLSESSISDIILIYCLNQQIFDLYVINTALQHFGQKPLTKQDLPEDVNALMGAVIGDVVGSRYEFNNIHTKDFPILSSGCDYTDDTIMTVAVADALMESRTSDKPFAACVIASMQRYGKSYPHPKGSYGGRFSNWLRSSEPQPYNSYGNGSAMRVSACGFAANSLEEAMTLAKESAEVTHNHPEGIKGAQAVAAAIYLAGTGRYDKTAIRRYISEHFYPLEGRSLAEIRENYSFSESCQKTVPEAIIAFLESRNYEDAIRNAVSIGGDSDTVAAITGSIAWAYYLAWSDYYPKDMEKLNKKVLPMLPDDLQKTIASFNRYTNKNFT